MLREVGYPDVYSRKTKHYLLGPRAADSGSYSPVRQLPITQAVGVTAEVTVFVSDQIEAARRDGESVRAALRVRIVQVGDRDGISFKFNGHDLAVEPADVEWIYGGSVSYTGQRGNLPLRIHTHVWFDLDVPITVVREGENAVRVTMDRQDETLRTDCVLHAVEIKV